jgi:hypothetical protein
MTADTSEPKVDNPVREQLVTLKGDLQKQMHELEGLLKKSSSDVGKGATWVGPTADAWHTEAEGRRKDMLGQLKKLIPLVEAEIAKCEPKVTLGQAKSMRADQARQQ